MITKTTKIWFGESTWIERKGENQVRIENQAEYTSTVFDLSDVPNLIEALNELLPFPLPREICGKEPCRAKEELR